MTEKDKKEIKTYMKKLSDNFGKQIGVYVEDVNGRFKALKEGTMATNEKLDRMEKTLDSHTDQIANLLIDMTIVKSDVKELKDDIASLKQKLDSAKSITEKQMWLNDLKEFEVEYIKWLKIMENIKPKTSNKSKKK